MATYPLKVMVTGDMKGLASSFSAISKKSALPIAALAGVTAGAVAAGKALYGVGEEFEEASNTIRTGTGKTGKALKGLEKDFRSVFGSVPTDMESASTAIADLNTRLGLTGKPLRGLSKQFLELSRMTGDEVGENIKLVSRAFGDWEVQTGKQQRQLDYFFRAAQESGAAVGELAKLVVDFGAPLRQMGFDLDEATAMFASFEKAGVNIQTMVPGLKFALKTFISEGRDPAKALQKTFEGISDGTISAEKALKLFGQRAGADMVEAVQQGRFNLDEFTKTIAGGTDSIMKAGKETRTASDNFQILGNKLKVLVAPAAEAVYNAVGKVSEALATMNFKPLLRDLGLSEQSLKDVTTVAEAMAAVFREVVVPIVRAALNSVKNQLQALVGVVKGVVKIVASVMRGDFGEAWQGVKDLFKTGTDFVKGLMRGLTAPMRLAAKGVDAALTGVFGNTWKSIKGIFEDGGNVAIGVLNSMIDLINKVPFVDIEKIGRLGGSGSSNRRTQPSGSAAGGRFGLQRGGPINLGAPSGDSVPAMLERDEYVLNRKAVKRVGKRTLDMINFGMAPRFQEGGPVHLSIGGDIAKAAKGIGSKAVGALRSVVPDLSGFAPKFPGWMDGSFFVDSALNWLLGKTKKQPKQGMPGTLGSAPGSLGAIEQMASAFGLTMTSGFRPGDPGWHGSNRARDFSNSSGPTPEMMQFALAVAGKYGSRLLELIYTPLGFSIDNGKQTPPFAQGDHYDHVHVAMQRGGLAGKDRRTRRHTLKELAGASKGWRRLQWDQKPLFNWTEVWNDLPNRIREFRKRRTNRWLENRLPEPWDVDRFNFIFADDLDKAPVFARLGGAVGMQSGGLAKKGPWAGSSIDRTYPKTDGYSGAKLPRYVIESLAEWAGLPGKTMYQIAMGESLGRPGVDISDPPGRSRGLFAINDHYNPQFGAREMRNPILNTLAAAELAGAVGGPNSNIWHGDKFVTGWNLPSEAKPPVAIARHLGGKGAKGGSAGGGSKRKSRHTRKPGTAGGPGGGIDLGMAKPVQKPPAPPAPAPSPLAAINENLAETGVLFDAPAWAASQPLEQANLELAEAEWKGNDAKVRELQEGLIAYWHGQLQLAKGTLETGDDIEAINAIQSLEEALKQNTEAEEREKAAREEHTAALKAVSEELKRQTDYAEAAQGSTSASAWKALADIMSGNLGARGQVLAALPGNGSIGSVGRF